MSDADTDEYEVNVALSLRSVPDGAGELVHVRVASDERDAVYVPDCEGVPDGVCVDDATFVPVPLRVPDVDDVRERVAVDDAVIDDVGLALGRNSATSAESMSCSPVSMQLSIAPPPPLRPAVLCAATRFGAKSDADRM